MISALSPSKRTQPDKQSYPRRALTAVEVNDNIVEAYNNLIDVINLYFLPGLGCLHCRTEWFMAQGELSVYPCIMKGCETQCFVCDGSYESYILPVIYDGALEFLQSRRVSDCMPFEINPKNCEEVLDLLFKDNDWLIRVFGKASVKKYNVAAFFFQLVGTKILSFERRSGKVFLVLNRDSNDQLHFMDIMNWEGILIRTSGGRGRGVIKYSFADLHKVKSN